jgi:hypothetical protein
MVTVRRIV